jgi:hypothetical protein
MNWYKQATSYEYIGDCRDTVDTLKIWDATQMAQLIENSSPLNPQGIMEIVGENFSQQIMQNPSIFEAGEYQSIVWLYNTEIDIHYFFRKKS